MDPYQVLQISPAATREEIRSAYRILARRWHPDRFMEGPERDWANDKMADINFAYRACLRGAGDSLKQAASEEEIQLKQISDLVGNGDLTQARRQLMTLNGRGPEWNYLLGMILMKTQDISKARIYLSIAAHQQPGNLRYVQALKSAEQANRHDILNVLKKHFYR